MNKTQQWEAIKAILTNGKVSKKVQAELEELLAPKSGGGTIYPPKVDKDGNITELYCTWHKEYEPVEKFKKSPKAKSGYHYECTDAEAEWKKYVSAINKLKKETADTVNKILDGEIDVKEAKELKDANEAKIEQYMECRKNKVDFKDCKLNA